MKNLFIMGMSRGGTTVTLDLFAGVPGLTLMNELPITYVERWVLDEGKTVAWKSPHDCLKGKYMAVTFPESVIVYVVRDGRKNLAAHKHYVETLGVEPSFAPYQGTKGFAMLWNRFAVQALTQGDYAFQLEGLTKPETGQEIIERIYELCEFPGVETAKEFWQNHIINRTGTYPRQAVDLKTPPWPEVLTSKEESWLNREMLKAFGYE